MTLLAFFGGRRLQILPFKGMVTLMVWLRARLQNLPFEGSGNPVCLVEAKVAEAAGLLGQDLPELEVLQSQVVFDYLYCLQTM